MATTEVGRRPTTRRLAGGGLLAGLWLLAAAPSGLAQTGSESSEPSDLALDTASLSHAPWSTMETLLEKTIFRVNVLTLTLRLGGDEADRLGSLLRGAGRSAALEDSVARVAAGATDAVARIEFHRTVSLGQFADAVGENLQRAAEDGFVSAADARRIGAAIPRWFAFLEERKIRDGDRILYRIRGDTLRTVFLSADGRVWLDQTDVGPERRLAVLGSYLARRSDFRDGLLRSLFRRAARSRTGS